MAILGLNYGRDFILFTDMQDTFGDKSMRVDSPEFSKYSPWPYYYTHFVFVDRIKSPIIDDTHI